MILGIRLVPNTITTQLIKRWRLQHILAIISSREYKSNFIPFSTSLEVDNQMLERIWMAHETRTCLTRTTLLIMEKLAFKVTLDLIHQPIRGIKVLLPLIYGKPEKYIPVLFHLPLWVSNQHTEMLHILAHIRSNNQKKWGKRCPRPHCDTWSHQKIRCIVPSCSHYD